MKLPLDDEEYEDDQDQDQEQDQFQPKTQGFQLQDDEDHTESRNGLKNYDLPNDVVVESDQLVHDDREDELPLETFQQNNTQQQDQYDYQNQRRSHQQPINQTAVEAHQETEPTSRQPEPVSFGRSQNPETISSKRSHQNQDDHVDNQTSRTVQAEQKQNLRQEQQANPLTFRVINCSSQDANYLVTELAAPRRDPANIRGWQSQRFCVYPQELIVQFQQPVKIQKIQFLIHESFIPQQIHLSSYMPGKSIEEIGMSGVLNPNTSQNLFNHLGSFPLDDNRGTNYQSRELKTVYLDLVTQYFKIGFSKNYDNRLNKFNQVGVVKLQFTGNYLGEYEIKTFYQSQGNNNQFSDPPMHQQYSNRIPEQPHLQPRNLKLQTMTDSDIDPSLMQKLKIVQEKKEEAVRNEDYDVAMELKIVCDNLKVIANDLIQLESRKIQAINGEDFESAKIIKAEILRLKKQLDQIDPHHPLNRNSYPSQRSLHNNATQKVSTIQNTMDQSLNQREITHQAQEYLDQEDDDGMADLQFRNNIQQQQQYDDYGQEEEESITQSFRETPTLRLSPTSKKFKNYDDQAVPALALKQPIDFKNITDEDGGGIGGSSKPDQNESLEYRDIPATMKTFADALLPYYGELCCAKLFHRRWQFREEGVTEFVTEMTNVFRKGSADNLTAVNSAVLNTLVEILKDKVQQIITKSFEAIEQYIKQLQSYNQLTVKADQASIEKLLTYILDRLTDSRLFQKTLRLYLGFYDVSQIDQLYLTSFLFKQSSFINKQNATQTNHLSQRLRIVEMVAIGKKAELIPTDAIFPAIKACINASVADQRKVAHTVTIVLYQKLGWKKVEYLVQSGFGQKLLIALKPEMPEVAAYIKKE